MATPRSLSLAPCWVCERKFYKYMKMENGIVSINNNKTSVVIFDDNKKKCITCVVLRYSINFVKFKNE